MTNEANQQDSEEASDSTSVALSARRGARDLTASDRRELRSLIRKQFAVLRADVKRREIEMKAEAEAELLARYRLQDERIEQARRELETLRRDYLRAQETVFDGLREMEPTLRLTTNYLDRLEAKDPRRVQLHSALSALIPERVAAAQSALDAQELDLLRELTVGALDSDQARGFLQSVATVGSLVPKARLAEIEGSAASTPGDPWASGPFTDEPPF
jgi:hypothetical protein